MSRAGFVAILGRPNVGKSTLLNALLGEKIAAVTSKPQTTRHRLLGIKTTSDAQLLFLDTPGLHRPHKSLNESMVEAARSTFGDADLFLVVVEPTLPIPADEKSLALELKARRRPIVVAVNKIDTVAKDKLLPVLEAYLALFDAEAIVPIAARSADGLDRLETEVAGRLPEGAPLYPEDQLTDQTERFLAAETIREKVMSETLKEVPYSVAVVVEDYREPREEDVKKVVRIRASIIVERDSQKGILIGKGGQMIKKFGEQARRELEARLGQQVFLELFVRVEPDWTHDPQKVREYVYSDSSLR